MPIETGCGLCAWCVQLDALVNFGMLGSILWEYFCYFGGIRAADIFNLAAYGVRVEAIVQSSLAGERLAVRLAGFQP